MDTNRINRYENGEMTEPDVAVLFADLYNQGVLLHLQGSYHRKFNDLLEQEIITIDENNWAVVTGIIVHGMNLLGEAMAWSYVKKAEK